jgi:hypothetical protein
MGAALLMDSNCLSLVQSDDDTFRLRCFAVSALEEADLPTWGLQQVDLPLHGSAQRRLLGHRSNCEVVGGGCGVRSSVRGVDVGGSTLQL